MEWRRDAYKGERCFIIGTGASLLFELDLPKLETEFTVTCNGLFLWTGMPFVPTVWCCIDHPAFPVWRERIEALDTFRVAGLREGWPTETPKWQRVLQRRDLPIGEGCWGGTEQEFTWFAARANVVLTLCSQMAFWLGFKDVYLLGVDGWRDDAPLLHVYEVQDWLQGKLDRTPSSVDVRTQMATRRAVPAVTAAYEKHGRSITNLNPDTFNIGMPTGTLREVLC